MPLFHSKSQMVKFQMRNLGDDILGSEKMKITPLGAGSEVGRSCIIVEFKGKTIMVITKEVVNWFMDTIFIFLLDGLRYSSGLFGNVCIAFF